MKKKRRSGSLTTLPSHLEVRGSVKRGAKRAVLPLMIFALLFPIDKILATMWGKAGQYFSFPFEATGLTILCALGLFYLIGRMPKTHLWIKTIGRLWLIQPSNKLRKRYIARLLSYYNELGFLTPVLVDQNGQILFDSDWNVTGYATGRQRRALFLREVENIGPHIPEIRRRKCEVALAFPTPVLVVERYEFPFVERHLSPPADEFYKAITFSGMVGYEREETMPWEQAREVLEPKALPDKDRLLLEELGVLSKT